MPKKQDTSLGETLGTARRVGSYDPKSPEWHDLRATGIGGSEVAAIVGCSPWKSAVTLWAEKTKQIEREEVTNPAAEWGTRLEPVVLDKFAELHPELKLHRDAGTWTHVERPWQLSNPDAIYETADGQYGIIEVKTARYEDDWYQGVPVYYATQVQWYLQTFGFSHAYVVVLFQGSKYVEYELAANDFEQQMNLDTALNFRACVADHRQPDYDGSASTYDTIRKLHPEIDPEGEEDLGDLGMYYTIALKEQEQAERHLNEMKSRVLDAMGKAKKGLVEGNVIVTRQARGNGAPYLVNKKG
jgi:putative phage-type endonuclease